MFFDNPSLKLRIMKKGERKMIQKIVPIILLIPIMAYVIYDLYITDKALAASVITVFLLVFVYPIVHDIWLDLKKRIRG